MGRKMKIGISYSRCVRDIIENKVSIDDVLVIIARTNFDPENDNEWNAIWQGYSGTDGFGARTHPEWNWSNSREQEVRDLSIKLKKDGKLHQPRKFGAHPNRLNHHWYDVILSPEDLKNNPAAESAWEDYKIAAKLGSVKPDASYVFDDNF